MSSVGATNGDADHGEVKMSRLQKQKLKRAVIPAGKSKPLSEILALWTHQGAGAKTGMKSAPHVVTEGAV